MCNELPVSAFGVTVAKVGAGRFVLLAQAINLQYHNNLSPDDINASGFSITACSMAGVQAWTRAFPGATTDGDDNLGNLAAVGDCLASDDDEVRVVAVGNAFRYVYISPKTGKNIRVVTTTPPSWYRLRPARWALTSLREVSLRRKAEKPRALRAAAYSPAAARSAAALSVRSQVNSGSSRPKCP